ncbi:hypothetical protein CHGG_08513 [Chaetomium globosum CBS 148.51]|uniref:Carboxylesterase type B domain-containing protein n=1 Tax=Chaetomium globosum (strain ATCC 6205 / CBS 148.51 / DSM 1962 / NBRC 6347 / NRRL 1970) TaxID=306901 RepID=Q2GU41_CHAGB|nr:uncharacterized protein CHGG_08513 [Chaetomium globosum CBS 148.51]EAQ84499.1 hypothetical protein CHGG_08513 [Chaetomium globosum CBS 148.51]
MRYLHLVIALAAPLVAASACRPPKWRVGQPVQTSSGAVQGHAASTASEVSEYLGIPYAQPPVGALRFQPPVRYTGKGKIGGKSFELIDVYGITEVGRRILATITNPGIPVSEDCLTLNVWTKPQTGEKRKPVMVYIHGGSFVSGNITPASMDDFTLTISIVSPSLDFRVIHMGTKTSGLLDQRMAIEWVRDNIASFRAATRNASLCLASPRVVPPLIRPYLPPPGPQLHPTSNPYSDYSFAWPHDPIVAGLISMSGTASGITPRPTSLATSLWYNTTRALNCGDAHAPPSTQLTCMQSIPAPALIATLLNTISAPHSTPYSPTIDEHLVFTNPNHHPTAHIPLLIGTTDNESGLFRVFVPPQQPTLTPSQENIFWHGQNQRNFVCPAAARAGRSAREGIPTWRYRWHGVFPNTELATTPPSGAYHDSEVAVLFGTVDGSVVGDTEGEGGGGEVYAGGVGGVCDGARGGGWRGMGEGVGEMGGRVRGRERGRERGRRRGGRGTWRGRRRWLGWRWEGEAGGEYG